MRFGYTILYVNDVSETIGFYERAFGMSRAFVADDGDYGELATGDTVLAFASHALGEALGHGEYRRNDPTQPPPGIEIALVTDDVAAAWKTALAAGATPYSPPTDRPWGQTVAYVRDLEGMLVELCTPVGG